MRRLLLGVPVVVFLMAVPLAGVALLRRKAFGKPSKVAKQGQGACTVTWKKLALQVRFYSLSAESSACGFFAWGEVRSVKWSTAKGLKVGMPLAKLRKLYRGARLHKGAAFDTAGAGTYWLATKHYSAGPVFDYPTLHARVAHGRVVGLGVSFPSDGA